MEKLIVTLGAGHGGIDGGAVGSTGVAEKDLTLSLALKTAELLRATGQIDARLTREDDSFLNLPARGHGAARLKSRCHIELHVEVPVRAEPSVAVIYSMKVPGDAATADAMAEGIAQALGARSAGGSTRPGREHPGRDYHTVMLTALQGGVPHILQAEIGVLGVPEPEARLQNEATMLAVAAAIAQPVCALLGVNFRLIRTAPAIPDAATDKEAKPHPSLGAGETLPTCSARAGRTTTPASQKFPAVPARTGRTLETVASGAWFVHVEPDFSSEVLGTAFGGQQFETEPVHTGFRRIIFSGRIGYLSAGAFRTAPGSEAASGKAP